MRDEYGIPDHLFGSIDADLPAFVGRIVMVSALIEHQVAAMVAWFQDLESNHYFAQDPARNFDVCRQRFRYFPAGAHTGQIALGRKYLSQAKRLLGERNEVVYRVWSVASGDVWGGHKGMRRQGKGRRAAEKGWDYPPARLKAILAEMVTVCDFERRSALPLVLALPRLPTPWADGI